MKYEEQLRSPQWWYVRDRVLERDGWRCKNCGSGNNLQVHHRYYIHGRKAWEYHDEALVTLCERCHAVTHGKGTPFTSLEIALHKLVIVASGVRSWCMKQVEEENNG